MSTLDSFFATVKLPTMSEVAHDLIRTMNDEEAPMAEVRNIIAKDPALTAKLLRLANSAQFGLQRGVGTLDDAITMVGMSKVRILSLGSCLNDSFPSLPGLDRNEFWKASMACAGYAQWLAARLNVDSQQAWLTGLMLRLGELLIGQADPTTLKLIEELPHLPGGRWEREKNLVGFTEGQVTAELARRWNFPKEIVLALQSSSDPVAEHVFSKLGAIIHLAGLIADTPDAGPDIVETLPQDVIAKLILDAQWMQSHFPDANSFVDVAN
jgi:HD-like signal output (HDOD) protein